MLIVEIKMLKKFYGKCVGMWSNLKEWIAAVVIATGTACQQYCREDYRYE
jgi:hypothetical protein